MLFHSRVCIRYGYGTTDVNHKNAASQQLGAIAAGYGRDIVLSN